jgi:hypothetical protein
MTFGTTSSIFRQYLVDALAPTGSFTPHLGTGGTWKVALYNDTGTPDNDDTAAHNAYNGAGGAWVTTNELIDTLNSNWVAGGRSLVYSGGTGATGTRWNVSTADTIYMDADDTAGAGNVTITGARGDLLYDDALTTPVAKQGLAYHAYGSAQTVTNGTFTVVWHSNGLVRWVQTAA